MIAAIGEGKTLGDTAPHDGRVGRLYANEVVLLRANLGACQAKPRVADRPDPGPN